MITTYESINIPSDRLNQLYAIDRMSCREIGYLFNCSKRPILRLLKKYGIRIRVNGEDKVGKPSWNKGIEWNECHKNRLSNLRKGIKHTEETKNKIGKSHVGLKYKKWSLESRKKLSESKKGLQPRLGAKATPETIKKLSDSHKGIIPSSETREKLSVARKKQWTNESYRNKMLSLNIKMSNTKPELKLLSYYKSNGLVEDVDIIKQYYVKGVVSADFYLPKENTLIFVDGDYWHCNPNKYKPCYYHEKIQKFAYDIWEKDNSISAKCQQLGFRVIRIWERDVDNFIKNGAIYG